MYEIGKTEDYRDAEGLAFLIHPKINVLLIVGVIKMEINLQEQDSVTVINAYAPTSSAPGNDMVKDSKRQRKLEGYFRQWMDTA